MQRESDSTFGLNGSGDAIIVAAGKGERLGRGCPKGRIPVGGIPMFVHSVRPFFEHSRVDRVLLVLPAGKEEAEAAGAALKDHLGPDWSRKVILLTGGEHRQDSVGAGLRYLSRQDVAPAHLVLVHDAARPLVSGVLVDRCLDAMLSERPQTPQGELPGLSSSGNWGSGPAGVVPGLPVRETLKLVYEDRVLLTQPRDGVYSIQTPQVFRFGPLYQAFLRAQQYGLQASDDAALLEWVGIPVFMVPGEATNLKITYPQDLHLAEVILAGRGLPPAAGAA